MRTPANHSLSQRCSQGETCGALGSLDQGVSEGSDMTCDSRDFNEGQVDEERKWGKQKGPRRLMESFEVEGVRGL